MTLTDEELMQAYAEGDTDAFRALYERHKNSIFGYLLGKLKDHGEAEEVFQTIFDKLHRARGNYRPEIPFLPWIFTIARNALIDNRRQDKTRQAHVTLSEDVVAACPAPRTEHSPFSAALAELSSLNESQRQVLELRFNQGLTFLEIAERLQLSPDNSRQIASRAIARLRTWMTGKEAHDDRC